MPALLTRTSIFPNSATVRATSPSTWSAFVTSLAPAIARRPSARASAAPSSAVSALRSESATSQPSRASRSAIARPIPRPAPVISATLPSSPYMRPSPAGSAGLQPLAQQVQRGQGPALLQLRRGRAEDAALLGHDVVLEVDRQVERARVLAGRPGQAGRAGDRQADVGAEVLADRDRHRPGGLERGRAVLIDRPCVDAVDLE